MGSLCRVARSRPSARPQRSQISLYATTTIYQQFHPTAPGLCKSPPDGEGAPARTSSTTACVSLTTPTSMLLARGSPGVRLRMLLSAEADRLRHGQGQGRCQAKGWGASSVATIQKGVPVGVRTWGGREERSDSHQNARWRGTSSTRGWATRGGRARTYWSMRTDGAVDMARSRPTCCTYVEHRQSSGSTLRRTLSQGPFSRGQPSQKGMSTGCMREPRSEICGAAEMGDCMLCTARGCSELYWHAAQVQAVAAGLHM